MEVTSLGAAALHDVITALQRRVPHIPVVIAPAQVQGNGAAPSLIQALQAIQKIEDVDVVLLVRGGGSLEDLWAFNEEPLVRAVAARRLPPADPRAMLDLERAARTSGARFAYLLGPMVRLQMALVSWAVDLLADEGFTPVIPPVLVREEALVGTGFFPADRSAVYATADDDLFLVGTSEVPLAALHQDEILSEDDLPLRYAGISSCFRREAGAAGRDTRGIFRVHQFDKVEMFSFTTPEQSDDEHQRILGIEERILGELGIPYRVVDIAVGDLGASAARKFDCEAWMPGQERYREVTSCSNCTDYQGRRLKARTKRGKETIPVHTLNGTAVAVGRTLIAILENHQRPDGSVVVPECLRPFGAPEVLGKG
jgi:seryl-tRNA synthetase